MRKIVSLPNFSQESNDLVPVFPAERLVFHSDSDLPANILIICLHVIVLLLRPENERIRAIANGILVPYAGWSKCFETDLVIVSIARCWCWSLIVYAVKMPPDQALLVTASFTGDIQLIARGKVTVRLRFRPFVVCYIRQRTQESLQVRFWDGTSSFAFVWWPMLTFIDTNRYRSTSPFSRDHLSILLLTHFTTWKVKIGRLIDGIVTS